MCHCGIFMLRTLIASSYACIPFTPRCVIAQLDVCRVVLNSNIGSMCVCGVRMNYW
jgi:hypothetical protein